MQYVPRVRSLLEVPNDRGSSVIEIPHAAAWVPPEQLSQGHARL